MQAFRQQFSNWLTQKVPFVFLIDYELEKPLLYTLDEAVNNGLFFNVKGKTNVSSPAEVGLSSLEKKRLSFENYKSAFERVYKGIYRGDSFLVNLTFPTEITLKNSLEDIFYGVNAPYKLYLKNQFVLFSPECFIKIEGDEIAAFP